MGSRRNSLLFLLALLLLAAGCREPLSEEQYCLGRGPYTFRVQMADTLKAYDLDLYSRLDGDVSDLDALQEIALWMDWTSPSGKKATEKVYLPLRGRSSFFSRQVREPYRAGIRPSEAGEWTLIVTPITPPEMLVGMGLIVTKRPWDTEN